MDLVSLCVCVPESYVHDHQHGCAMYASKHVNACTMHVGNAAPTYYVQVGNCLKREFLDFLHKQAFCGFQTNVL